ncbi:MAG: DUF6788 family protein [Candidatus Woesearchaeota archaeon]
MECELSKIYDEIKSMEKNIEGRHDNGLSGTLIMKAIKCGKPGCKCREGYLHGPYPHIQYYNDEHVLKTIYIRKKQKEEYEEKLALNKDFRKKIKKLIALHKKRIKLEKEVIKEASKINSIYKL